MKFNDFFVIITYFAVSFVVIFIIDQLTDVHFFDVPYENCRILTNYNSEGIYYGGLFNFLGAIGLYFLKGIVLLGFVLPTIYLLDRYLFKNYLLKADKKNQTEISWSYKIAVLLFLPIPPIVYDFLPFLMYDYSCLELIKIINMY